jgi:glutathione synthase/RimK-type ligase-like ATP-grasp enzyme
MLVEELRERGLRVSVEIWSDPRADWAASRLCILRSTWDYHSRCHDFLRWVEDAAAVTTIRNGPHLLAWNAHKSYLRDLDRRGVPVVPTAWLPQGQNARLTEVFERCGRRDVVVKPARGAAAQDVVRVSAEPASLPAGQAHLDRLLQTQDVLVQPYLPAVVTYGERALIFFGGVYSHTVAKAPFDTVLAISYSSSPRVEATADEIEVATKAVAAIPGDSLYARVDLLRDDAGNVLVSELELIEPALYLGVFEPARTTFADAIERELGAVSTSPG